MEQPAGTKLIARLRKDCVCGQKAGRPVAECIERNGSARGVLLDLRHLCRFQRAESLCVHRERSLDRKSPPGRHHLSDELFRQKAFTDRQVQPELSYPGPGPRPRWLVTLP